MSDPRFARLKSDPRFRRPKKKSTKVVIDERFKSVFEQGKKKNAGRKVDKYGRPISDTQEQEDLRRYYRLEDDAENAEGEDVPPPLPDLARGAVLLESSDEEEENDDKEKDSESEDEGFVTLGADSSRPISVPADEDAEIDLNEDDNYADLEAQAANYAKEYQDEEEEQEEQPRTRRLAVVNLDWDHVRANHLYKICASLVSPIAPIVRASAAALPKEKVKGGNRRNGKNGEPGTGPVNVARGKVLSVRVYPSDFGKKRMEREEKEGPPSEIFKKKELDPNDINEKTVFDVGGEEEYDEDALRKYQLERLRYYYAVVTCDTVDAASHIYNELEGTELERSANVFDMSFVPDDMEFENEPRDEATEVVNTTYNPVDYVTDALRHSKVKLTWDDDDPERNHITRRTLTRKEIEENDFKAYIANSSDDSEEEAAPTKQKDKKASRDKLRSLLLGGNEEAIPEGWGDDDNGADDDVDMEITFTPGLSAKKDEDEETTLERYQRKMKEKRKKRKEEVKQSGQKDAPTQKAKVDDDFFEPGSDSEHEDITSSKKSKGKGKGKKDTAEKDDDLTRTEATAEELALLVASDNPTAEPKHFSLKSVIKAEKKKRRRKGRKDKGEDDNEAQEDFNVDVKDERFRVLFEDHQFAIDPTNPHFKKTKAMTTLLEERQRRQKELRGGQDESISSKPKSNGSDNTKSLQNLVESVKRKSANIDPPGQGKRRKL